MEDLVWRQTVYPFVLEDYPSLIGDKETGYQVEQRGLTRPVGTYQTRYSTRFHPEGAIVDGLYSPKMLDQTVYFKHVYHFGEEKPEN